MVKTRKTWSGKPAKAAKRIVKLVMVQNRHRGSTWKNQDLTTQIEHAIDHLTTLKENLDAGISGNEDHLAHALTRLAFAVVLRNQGYINSLKEGSLT
jgi:hypothetical protein